jgi:2-dehydropantoate 2-reductase
MRVGIVGFGAIGGWFGYKLAAAGHEVSAFARGATLAALSAHGVRWLEDGQVRLAPVVASDDPTVLGEQDLVVVAVKGPGLAAVAPAVAAMSGPSTTVLPAMNGAPWWFFEGLPGELAGRRLTSIDPDSAIARSIPASRVVGCVVHAACGSPEPGLIHVRAGNGLIIGEPSGVDSARLTAVTQALREGGFDVTVSPRIQADIWYKLWGNMTMNPISAVTGATCDRILDDPLVNSLVRQIMAEAAEVGARIGCPISESAEDRNAVTRKLGAFKTSMLQDVEAGRSIELDALLAAPREIAGWVGVPTPSMDALFGLVRLFAQTRGLYPNSPAAA